MRFSGYFVLLVLAVLCGCSGGPYPGYDEVGENIYCSLRAFNEEGRIPTDSDSVRLRVRIARIGQPPGSIFSSERWFGRLADVLPDRTIPVLRLREGDSASVISPGAVLRWEALGITRNAALDTVPLQMEVALQDVRSFAESRRMAHELLMARTASDETRILDTYLAGSREVWKEFMGVRYILDPGNKPAPVIASGQLVSMHYTAEFLDTGERFDDTRRGGAPLTFRLGDPGQVIKGLEIAAHVLPTGGKGRFLIPSEHAFGPKGSSAGIVPPFTPVLYSIEAWVVEPSPTAQAH